MLIPNTYQAALFLMILSAVFWGSWANTQKMAGPKLRFELFYIDFSLGSVIFAIVACLTLGSFNQADITFSDSLIGLSFRKAAWAILGGMVFNVANVMLVAAISIVGLSVAFPVGLGVATLVGVILAYFMNLQGNATMIWVGLGFLVLGIVVNVRAYKMMAIVRKSQEVTLDPNAPAAPPKRVRKTGKTKTVATKGIWTSVICGVLLGCYFPLVELSREGELGLSPYGVILFFTLGIAFSSMLIVPFIMNFPMEGEPLGIVRFFQEKRGLHLLGIVGGVLWMAGLTANILASSVPKAQSVGPSIGHGLSQGAMLLAAIWGLVVWKEFADTGARVQMQLVLMFVLFVISMALVSLAPMY